MTTVFCTGLTMVPKRFESLISGTVEKSTAESARRWRRRIFAAANCGESGIAMSLACL